MTTQTPEVKEPTTPLEQMLFEVKKVIVGQEALLERIVVALLARGHILVEGVPGSGQDAGHPHRRPGRRRCSSTASSSRPTSCPPTSSARASTTRRTATSATSLRPRLHQPPARGRDQPRARQGAVGAARGHAGAPGDDRPRVAQGAGALPRPGDPEPDRDRGHLRAARGPGRPLHAQGARRLPNRARGAGRRPAHDRHACAPSRQIITTDDLMDAAEAGRRRLRRPGADGVRRAPRRRHATARRTTAWATSPTTSPSAPALALRSTSSSAPAPWPSPAAATTSCRRTSPSWRPDVLRHRLVLSYEALADRVTADEIIDRMLERVPRPQRPFTDDPQRFAGAGSRRPRRPL